MQHFNKYHIVNSHVTNYFQDSTEYIPCSSTGNSMLWLQGEALCSIASAGWKLRTTEAASAMSGFDMLCRSGDRLWKVGTQA